MNPRLGPLDGGIPIEIALPVVLLGRNDECDVRLDDESVSELHCVVVMTDRVLLLRDLGSANGTRVNSQRVRRAILLPNDDLHIGRLRFRVAYPVDWGPPGPNQQSR